MKMRRREMEMGRMNGAYIVKSYIRDRRGFMIACDDFTWIYATPMNGGGMPWSLSIRSPHLSVSRPDDLSVRDDVLVTQDILINLRDVKKVEAWEVER